MQDLLLWRNKPQMKYPCIKNNVKYILSKNEMKPILEYITSTYGRNYLKSFIYKKEQNA